MRRVFSQFPQSMTRNGSSVTALRSGHGVAVAMFCALSLLCAASSVQASVGPYSTWGNQPGQGTSRTDGGGFGFDAFGNGGPTGLAVNESTGDVYAVDQGNHRVQRFTGSGEFISAWGFDVVQSGQVLAGDLGTSGFEKCVIASACKQGINTVVASAGVGTGGEFSLPRGVAVDQSTGNVYVSDGGFNRVQVFTASGDFVRAFGQDVVFGTGGENNPATASKQNLAVDATAGQYRLTFKGQTTADIAFDATAAQVDDALDVLSTINGDANVTVTGGPGSAGGATPYVITFAGALNNSPQPLITTTAGTTPLSGGAGSATVAYTTPPSPGVPGTVGSSGFEVCTNMATCKAGAAGVTAGAFGTAAAPSGLGYPAVAPAGAPNAGNVLVPDAVNTRVQEFTSAGVFVRAFGWDVASAGPGNTGTGFEVCKASTFDVCKDGSRGAGVGQFGRTGLANTGTPNRIAEDPAGNIYTVETRSNFRVQKFTLPSNTPTPQGVLDAAELSPPGTVTTTSPTEIAVDGTGTVHVIKNDDLLKIDPAGNGGTGQVVETLLEDSGVYVDVGGIGQGTPGAVPLMPGLAVRSDGQPPLYVSQTGPSRIFRLDEVTGLSASVSATEVGASSAVLEAMVTPAAIPLTTRYRFEYSTDGVNWEQTPIPDADIGNGSGDGDPATCPVANPATCELRLELPDLDINTTYSYRLVAASLWHGQDVVTPTQTFMTSATLPTVRAGVASWSSPVATEPSLVLRGEVNPQATRTTYQFEYLPEDEFAETGWDTAKKAPAQVGEAGHGSILRELIEVVNELDPTIDYRYRLLATNANGTTTGTGRVVTSPSDDDRFLELVSEGDVAGVGLQTGDVVVSDDRQRASFRAQAFGDPNGLPHYIGRYVAERDDSGWSVTPNGAGVDRDGAAFDGVTSILSSDLRRLLWRVPTLDQVARGELQWTFGDLDGNLSPVGPLISPISMTGLADATYGFEGGAQDLSTIVFSQPAGSISVTLLPGESPVPASNPPNSNLYRLSGLGGSSSGVTLINRAPDGSQVGGACGARVGNVPPSAARIRKARAVSADASVVFFSARAGAPATGSCNTSFPVRLYKRIGDSSTVAVSESQCTRTSGDPGGVCSSIDGDDEYMGASEDGTQVFFTSPRQLTNTDQDTTPDLYVYDADPPTGEPNLAQASAGEVTADHPTVGAGANVLGAADVAADGSRVYFVASGRLTADAAQGANNLYVYQRDDTHPQGRIALVAQLKAGAAQVGGGFSQDDSDIWYQTFQDTGGRPAIALPFFDGQGDTRVVGDGRYLLFKSMQALVAGDEDTADDLYRYDDEADALECLSCAGDNDAYPIGATPRRDGSAAPSYVQENRFASEDVSSVVFTTREALTANDSNAEADVYVWHEDGGLELASVATGRRGAFGYGLVGTAAVTLAPAISADGGSVFFGTQASLVPQDRNNLRPDYYVARVGGGFPLPDSEQRCEALADACQGGGSDTADAPRNTGSGGGNAPSVDRPVLSVATLGAKARRRAANSGVVGLRIRSSSAGMVRVTARGKVGKRSRKLGSASKRFTKAGSATVKVRLSRAARRALADGRRLKLSIDVRSAGARPRTLSIVLRRAGK